LGEVAGADFVVVHLGVIAVAIAYDGENAPVVLVKGERRLARAIAEVARTAGVPVLDEPDLAQALSVTEEGHEISESLFEQVAALLVASGALRRGPN
jgi:flagellar biosynthesis protein FlhB